MVEPNPRLCVDFGAVTARGEKAEALEEARKEKVDVVSEISRAVSNQVPVLHPPLLESGFDIQTNLWKVSNERKGGRAGR